MTERSDRFNAVWHDGPSAARAELERELSASGSPLPLRSRIQWIAVQPAVGSALLVVESAAGERAVVGVEAHPSRSMPRHVVWRIPQVAEPFSVLACEAVIAAITLRARQEHRVLRVHFEVFTRDEHQRRLLGDILSTEGFEATKNSISYKYTLASNLRDMNDERHLASLARRVRQSIKAIEKFPLRIDSIEDVAASPRMNELMRETLARTGAHHREQDYTALIKLGVQERSLVHLVGLFRTDTAGPEGLLAFALGVNNGDHVTYDIGASARIEEFRNLSMGYALLWELIVWARAQGVSWFDFGGVSIADAEGADPLGRISDFKRRFAKDVVHVADEWLWSPRPWRDSIAKSISRGAAMVRRLR